MARPRRGGFAAASSCLWVGHHQVVLYEIFKFAGEIAMPRLGLIDLAEQHLRIEHDAVADHVDDAGRKTPTAEDESRIFRRDTNGVPAWRRPVADDDVACSVRKSTILPLPSSPIEARRRRSCLPETRSQKAPFSPCGMRSSVQADV